MAAKSTQSVPTYSPSANSPHARYPKRNSNESICCRPMALWRTCCWALPTFHPYGPVRLGWDSFVMVALIYTAVEIPLTIAFDLQLSLTNALGIIAFCIDMILLIDIGINFRTQYYDKWDRLLLHTNPFHIAKRYLRGWFWLDLITSLPLEFIVDTTGKSAEFAVYIKVLRIFRFVRILKILRVIRVMKMFDGLTKLLRTREVYLVFRVFKIMGAMVLTAHYFACIWWYVGIAGLKDEPPYTNEDGVTIYSSWIQSQGIENDDTLFVKYSASWYWAIVTLFTTGYGDITAHNTTEQWVCSICILCGSCFFAYFVGTLTQWVSEGDRVRAVEIAKVEEAQAFCRYHNFDRELTRTILSHVHYFCNYNFVFNSEDILHGLPPFLQRKVNSRIARKYISDLDLFKELPEDVIGQIALSMHSISCNAGKYLYKRKHVATCLYLLRTGIAEIDYLDGSKPRILTRGDVLGERSIIAGKRRYDVKCRTWSEFFVLNIVDIQNIFGRNFKPDRFRYEWNKIRHIVKATTTKDTRLVRKCNLANIESDDEDHQKVKQRQSPFATFMPRRQSNATNSYQDTKSSQKMVTPTPDPVSNNDGYQLVTGFDKLSDNTENEDCGDRGENTPISAERKLDKSSVLQIDDGNIIEEIEKIDVSQPCTSYQSEFPDLQQNQSKGSMRGSFNQSMSTDSATNQSTNNRRGYAQSTPAIVTLKKNRSTRSSTRSVGGRQRSGSSSKPGLLAKMSPFYVRHNSERRNEKVLSHTATVGRGVADSPDFRMMHSSHGMEDDDDDDLESYNTSDYDLDDVTDGSEHGQDILSGLTPHSFMNGGGNSRKPSPCSTAGGGRKMGKFGGGKRITTVKTTRRQTSYSPSPHLALQQSIGKSHRMDEMEKEYIVDGSDQDNNHKERDKEKEMVQENGDKHANHKKISSIQLSVRQNANVIKNTNLEDIDSKSTKPNGAREEVLIIKD